MGDIASMDVGRVDPRSTGRGDRTHRTLLRRCIWRPDQRCHSATRAGRSRLPVVYRPIVGYLCGEVSAHGRHTISADGERYSTHDIGIGFGVQSTRRCCPTHIGSRRCHRTVDRQVKVNTPEQPARSSINVRAIAPRPTKRYHRS